jgi:hypothetical protein
VCPVFIGDPRYPHPQTAGLYCAGGFLFLAQTELRCGDLGYACERAFVNQLLIRFFLLFSWCP